MSDAVRAVVAVFLLSMPALIQAQPGPFMGVYGEVHDLSHDIREGDVALRFDPADDGEVLGLNLGYAFSNHWFVSLDFSNADADDTEVSNITASANYHFPIGQGVPLSTWALLAVTVN